MIKHFCSKAGCLNLVGKGQRFCPEHSKTMVYCNYPGCNEKVLVTERYCLQHQPKKMFEYRRGNANHRGYSSRWARVSRQYLIDNPVCARCKVAPAVLVHHIKPIREGGDIFEPDNLMGLCASCHAIIHAEIQTRQHSK